MKIAVVPYDPHWPEAFAAIGMALRAELGEMAARIDHIGSTAVPGLASKDRIDIQIAVRDLSVVDTVRPRLETLGFEARPDITHDHVPDGMIENATQWEKRFFASGRKNRPTNIHLRRSGAANQRYPLLFRNYLRAHPASAAAYGELKWRLALVVSDLVTYTDVKDPACDLIMIAAEDWAQQHRWIPGTTDC
jgi:GrpB-like predicted nucleotidyltransferase (UPF0157 family)